MPEPQPFIVGREAEVARFAALLDGHTAYSLLNVYGPGGIGKTVVCQRLVDYARQAGVPCAAVDGFRPDLTPDRILYAVKEGIAADVQVADAFATFERQFQEYVVVQDVVQRSGGVQTMFDVVGNIKDQGSFRQILGGAAGPVTADVERTIGNRFALERYLRGIEKVLTGSLCAGLQTVVEQSTKPIALLFDTYEELEGLDDWVCRRFVRAVPDKVKIVILGRNALPKVNFDWGEFEAALHVLELPELAEDAAKRYLEHHGLRDAAALGQVYRFTGGYALLLVLVVHLARQAGGWDKIGTLDSEADRDRVATSLLDRILREERAREVRAFLEKGVVARWFNAEIVGLILGTSVDDSRAIYDKLQRHSFVERHPYGLKFHDKIRELLVERLKFTSGAEYDRLTRRLTSYYAEKAGIDYVDTSASPLAAPAPESLTTGKYVINIQSGQGIIIGDHPSVKQSLGGIEEPDMIDPKQQQRAVVLRQLLSPHLDLEEVRTVCFDLGIDYDNLRGEGKDAKLRELLRQLAQRSNLQILEDWVRQHRPDIALPKQG